MKESATILLLLKRVDCNDGVASYLETLVTGLHKAGDRVVIVSGAVTTLYGSERRRHAIEAATSEWVVLDGLKPARPSAGHLRAMLGTIVRHDVDVISPQGFAVHPLAVVLGTLRRRPVVTNFHLLPDVRPALMPLAHAVYRAVTFAFRARMYIAMSSEIEEFFRRSCGIAARRIHRQMLGIDTAFYREPSVAERQAARRRFDLADDTLVAVLPARMNRTKGHELTARAYRLLRTRRPQAHVRCLFAGAGDERPAIEADVLRDAADRATFCFLGFVDRQTLRDAYWASDIVLLPSRVEGFGLAVAEAMCCGAIVIRTPSGGWRDQVIEGTTGYVVPFDDAEALAGAIERVLSLNDRGAMRADVIQYASSTFSAARMIEGTSKLYRSVGMQRPHRPRERRSAQS